MQHSKREFLDAIRQSPDDDTLRLVYADWLEENNEPYRARFIRAQVELAQLRTLVISEADAVKLSMTPEMREFTMRQDGMKWLIDDTNPNRKYGLPQEWQGKTIKVVKDAPDQWLAKDDVRFPRYHYSQREHELDWELSSLAQLRLSGEWGAELLWLDSHDAVDSLFFLCERGLSSHLKNSWAWLESNLDAIYAEHPIQTVELTDMPNFDVHVNEKRVDDKSGFLLVATCMCAGRQFSNQARISGRELSLLSSHTHRASHINYVRDNLIYSLNPARVLALRWPGVKFNLHGVIGPNGPQGTQGPPGIPAPISYSIS